jgi:heme exporter protein A
LPWQNSQLSIFIKLDMTYTSQPVLEIDGLCCFRDELALFEAVDLRLQHGELLLIEGDNGVGKTTLLRALLGLRPLQWQRLKFDRLEGKAGVTALRADCSWMGHQPAMKADLSLAQNWQFWAALEGKALTIKHIEQLAQRLSLAGFEDAAFGTLSAGQKKRAQLGRLLNAGRQFWLLDEPFANLDALGIALVENELKQHLAAGGMALATSHGVLGFQIKHSVLKLQTAKWAVFE